MNFFYLIGILVFSYLIGSIPIAYLLARFLYDVDLRRFGKGDVSAFNFYRIKKDRLLTLLIIAFDLVKGALAAWGAVHFLPGEFSAVLLAAGGALFGDVFPVWLEFHGSRGLNVAAGLLLVIDPRLVGIWLVFFVVYYLTVRQHIIAILIATFSLPLFIFFTRQIYFTDNTLMLILLIGVFIFQRHLQRVPDLVEQKRMKIKNGEK